MICQATYEQIIANRTSQESKVSLRTIENITKLFSNFAKYGCVKRVNNFHTNICSYLNCLFQRTNIQKWTDCWIWLDSKWWHFNAGYQQWWFGNSSRSEENGQWVLVSPWRESTSTLAWEHFIKQNISFCDTFLLCYEMHLCDGITCMTENTFYVLLHHMQLVKLRFVLFFCISYAMPCFQQCLNAYALLNKISLIWNCLLGVIYILVYKITSRT